MKKQKIHIILKLKYVNSKGLINYYQEYKDNLVVCVKNVDNVHNGNLNIKVGYLPVKEKN